MIKRAMVAAMELASLLWAGCGGSGGCGAGTVCVRITQGDACIQTCAADGGGCPSGTECQRQSGCCTGTGCAATVWSVCCPPGGC